MSKRHPGSRFYGQLNQKRWQRTRRAVFARDGFRCTVCRLASRLEAHHDPPLHAGADPYDLDGIVTLCRPCHIAHHHGQTRPEQAAWAALVSELADL